MAEKKYVAVSVPNLRKIMAWCEGEGKDTYLAEAYLYSCNVVYHVSMTPDVVWPAGWEKIDRSSYQLRDSIGRFILGEIKKARTREPL